MKPMPTPHVVGHLIGGQRLVSGARQPIHDPATGDAIGEVSLADTAAVDAAVAAAAQALPEWSARTPLTRARVLFRFQELLQRHADDLARLISREHGKTLSDARGELTRAQEVVEFACGIPHLLKGERSHQVGRGIDSYSQFAAVGVCAGITPFNFPAMVPAWMFPIALACGNTFVLKPSELAPSCPLRLGELLVEAGAAPGVLNVVNGGCEAASALVAHPGVHAVSIVGSTPVARQVYADASAAGKRVQALGGAKNHLVVMPDADPRQVEDALIGAAYGSAGERCMAISVAVMVGDQDQLIARLVERVRSLRIGPGYLPEATHHLTEETASRRSGSSAGESRSLEYDMGPLVSAVHRHRVIGYIDAGVAEGATLLVDGRSHTPPAGFERGYYLGGTLFDHVQPHMRIYREEIFGPVLCIVRVRDANEALALVNGHPFGNGCALFSRDGVAARAWCDRVEAGMVGVNVPIPVPMAFHSFGGWKQSLFGALHMHGPDGVRFYTRMKTVTTRWVDDHQRGGEFTMPTLR